MMEDKIIMVYYWSKPAVAKLWHELTVEITDKLYFCWQHCVTDAMLQAPEVKFRQGSVPYTYKADYWSFGTLVFECIAARRPFFHSNNASRW